ncbi:3-hydroxyacyl-CoA dehydrogenase NAD-binding domain-containing protein [Paraburkholderia panacisoli]|uniref:3-hydroxyacyl-CoA dehydrogenase NAD-binding domain-containing protein n=1 Tax=Paraburkholderia panacisoli TaxID=2603818 RepID=UPI00319D8942
MPAGRVTFEDSIHGLCVDAAVARSDLIQENGPKQIDFTTDLYRRLDEALAPEMVIASSSSDLTMSKIQSACPNHPD